MTLPTGDSTEENFELKECNISNRLDLFVDFTLTIGRVFHQDKK